MIFRKIYLGNYECKVSPIAVNSNMGVDDD